MPTENHDPSSSPFSADFLLALNAANTSAAIGELADTVAATAHKRDWLEERAIAEGIARASQQLVLRIGRRIGYDGTSTTGGSL
jgi:hypothetical protein